MFGFWLFLWMMLCELDGNLLLLQIFVCMFWLLSLFIVVLMFVIGKFRIVKFVGVWFGFVYMRIELLCGSFRLRNFIVLIFMLSLRVVLQNFFVVLMLLMLNLLNVLFVVKVVMGLVFVFVCCLLRFFYIVVCMSCFMRLMQFMLVVVNICGICEVVVSFGIVLILFSMGFWLVRKKFICVMLLYFSVLNRVMVVCLSVVFFVVVSCVGMVNCVLLLYFVVVLNSLVVWIFSGGVVYWMLFFLCSMVMLILCFCMIFLMRIFWLKCVVLCSVFNS